ncbi:P-loop containing nucleoside triphosphate hydrolase protein [Chytridium lagenaria]|nr:P-loop containing nucleoside triphosphate hydrolase protein [Chytridium lagenaria]
MSEDSEHVKEWGPFVFDAGLMGLQIVASTTALVLVVGWPDLLWVRKVFVRLRAAGDLRMGVLNETLQGIKIIKYFGWEEKFLTRLHTARTKELHEIFNYYLQSFTNNLLLLLIPNLVAYFTLLTLTQYQSRVLTPQLAFTCLAMFESIKDPLTSLPDQITETSIVWVALQRIMAFLAEGEVERYHGEEGEMGIGFKDAMFTWFDASRRTTKLSSTTSDTEPSASVSSPSQPSSTTVVPSSATSSPASRPTFTIQPLTLHFPLQNLSVIHGPTGSGKSSLIQALLGEMHRLQGLAFLPSSCTKNSVAYVAQTAWLQNGTIRENILFGETFERKRYGDVSGDLTEIGEKGINLSGGQKQRVALARAIYSRAQHLLLDDPLSSVDAPTARRLLMALVALKPRTVVLVTHAMSLVGPVADFLVEMEMGRVVGGGGLVGGEVGTGMEEVEMGRVGGRRFWWRGLLEDGRDGESAGLERGAKLLAVERGGDGSDIVMSKGVTDNTDDHLHAMTSRPLPPSKDASTDLSDFSDGKGMDPSSELSSNEKRTDPSTDHSDFSNGNDIDRLIKDETMQTGAVKWRVYVSYLSACGGIPFLLLLVVVLVSGRSVNVGSAYWIREWTRRDVTKGEALYFANVYAGLCLVWIAFDRGEELGAYRGSKVYHDGLMRRLLYAPMRFFDTTPIGRILNLASKDIGSIDRDVMQAIANVMGPFCDVMFVVAVVGSVAPAFVVGVVPLLVVHGVVTRKYLRSTIELKRLESMTRGPVYALFSETLTGVTTIRAFNAEPRFIGRSLSRLDDNNRSYIYFWAADAWLLARLATVSAAMLCVAGGMIVVSRGRVDAGLVGIAVTWMLKFMEVSTRFARYYAKMEMVVHGVERVEGYLGMEVEREGVVEGNRPGRNWPDKGAVIVRGLEMRYSDSSPLVLHGISFNVAPGEKLGVVGRTGAGKSSLSLCLFRIVEPSAGTIMIDGIDITTIGLHDLRTRLCIIPQDPVLFRGTVRSNLDPFQEYDDESILRGLESVRFFDTVQRERGEGILDGQRQLLCIGRALLKKARIVVLDEATASVDDETDGKIQEVIRSCLFEGITVISIAHRLGTVADYDKILVLDGGRVVQHGTPLELMDEQGGLFRSMCEETGDREGLYAMASRSKKGDDAQREG